MKHMKNVKITEAFMIMLAITCVVFGSSTTVSATTAKEMEAVVEETSVESAVEVGAVEKEEVEENISATDATSGTYYGLSWSYSAGTLNISGSGDLQSGNNYPWSSFKASITKVVIGDFVTSIGEKAFYNMDNLTSVKIGSRVKKIDVSAFESCDSLSAVVIPASVTELGMNAFRECDNLETITFEDNSNIKTIGSYCFYECGDLKRVSIPKSVETIGYSAFYYCDSLISVTFEEGLVIIDDYAFAGTGVIEVVIPNTVTEVGNYAFKGCLALENVIIGNGVTAISDETFRGCSALTSVTMGNKVNTIEDNAFCDCKKLKDITWSENLNTIEYRAFYGCVSLTDIKLPNALKKIGICSFQDCTSLKEVEIGEKVANIYSTAFDGAPITKFVTYSTSTDINSVAFDDKSILTIYGWPNSTAQTFANTNNIVFKAIDTLATPTHRKITNVVSGVHVYWNEVLGASTYNVYRATSKTGSYTLVKKGVAASHYIDTTATSGKTYYYKVEAVRGSVKSQLSEPSTGIIYVGTPDITSRINKGAGIQLGWNKISGATGYAIYRKPYNGSTWTRVATISGNSTFTWTDESVKANNGTVYKYTIRALAGSNMKTLSGCRNTGRTMVRLASRTLSSATKATATSIKCNWTTSSAVTGYEVRFMVGDSVYKTYTIGNYKTGVKTFKDLKAGQTYKIQVRSYKKVAGVGSFYSAWSTAKYVNL